MGLKYLLIIWMIFKLKLVVGEDTDHGRRKRIILLAMFDELNSYTHWNHFFYKPNEVLSSVCNAPNDQSGVYIIYKLQKSGVELIYIGSSGSLLANGKIKHRKGGLYDRLVNGKQFGSARRNSWSKKMQEEKITAIDVNWYVTYREKIKHNPVEIEKILRQKFFDLHGRLPAWNKRLG